MKTISTLLSASALFVLANAAQAMPIQTTGPSLSDVTQVAQGCGPNGHRGPYGHCRRLYTCPPGWHTGPYGKVCTRNRY